MSRTYSRLFLILRLLTGILFLRPTFFLLSLLSHRRRTVTRLPESMRYMCRLQEAVPCGLLAAGERLEQRTRAASCARGKWQEPAPAPRTLQAALSSPAEAGLNLATTSAAPLGPKSRPKYLLVATARSSRRRNQTTYKRRPKAMNFNPVLSRAPRPAAAPHAWWYSFDIRDSWTSGPARRSRFDSARGPTGRRVLGRALTRLATSPQAKPSSSGQAALRAAPLLQGPAPILTVPRS